MQTLIMIMQISMILADDEMTGLMNIIIFLGSTRMPHSPGLNINNWSIFLSKMSKLLFVSLIIA